MRSLALTILRDNRGMNTRQGLSRTWLVLAAGVLVGILLWMFSKALFGVEEPWDAEGVRYPLALFIAGFVSAVMLPRRFWLGPIALYTGQAAYGLVDWLRSLYAYEGGGVNFFVPLGLIFLASATVPAFLGSLLGLLAVRLRRKSAAVPCILALLTLTSPAHAQTSDRWADDHTSRVEVLALMQTLQAGILASTSATETLERWCRDHRMASEPRIVAHRVTSDEPRPSADQLERLDVETADAVRYRRVELRCGAHVLSIADNWYVPSRLTDEMNQLLETSDTPFGKAVRPLQPYRRTIEANLLWTPLTRGWEQRPRIGVRRWRRRPLVIPRELFVHRAVLYTSSHVPFSEVVETYQGGLLQFPLHAQPARVTNAPALALPSRP
jgi:chorismate-pyruvate lyase